MPLFVIYHYKIILRTLVNYIIYLDLQISTDNKETFQHIQMAMLFSRFSLFKLGYGYLCYFAVCLLI